VFGPTSKLTRLAPFWFASILVGLMAAGSSLAGDVAIGLAGTSNSVVSRHVVNRRTGMRDGASIARLQFDAGFSPWCAKRPYMCVSQPAASFSLVGTSRDRSGSTHVLEFSTEASAANVNAQVH
jgi:hypothetical protein